MMRKVFYTRSEGTTVKTRRLLVNANAVLPIPNRLHCACSLAHAVDIIYLHKKASRPPQTLTHSFKTEQRELQGRQELGVEEATAQSRCCFTRPPALAFVDLLGIWV